MHTYVVVSAGPFLEKKPVTLAASAEVWGIGCQDGRENFLFRSNFF